MANATAEALGTICKTLGDEGAREAMQMQVAQEFIKQWGGIAKASNVMIVPADTGDVSRMVASAMKIVGADGKSAS